MIPRQIPYRLVINDMSEAAMKDRVTACRKRLREHRVSRAQAEGGDAGSFPKGFSARLMAQTSSSFLDAAGQIEDQEVGIT
jgi:hypothetical protein